MNPFVVAKEALARRGWCKGSRRNYEGQCCLLGAFESSGEVKSVYARMHPDAVELPVLRNIILERFRDRLGYDMWNGEDVTPLSDAPAVVACFNNHRATTLEDVNVLLDLAAAGVVVPQPEEL